MTERGGFINLSVESNLEDDEKDPSLDLLPCTIADNFIVVIYCWDFIVEPDIINLITEYICLHLYK